MSSKRRACTRKSELTVVIWWDRPDNRPSSMKLSMRSSAPFILHRWMGIPSCGKAVKSFSRLVLCGVGVETSLVSRSFRTSLETLTGLMAWHFESCEPTQPVPCQSSVAEGQASKRC